jgi:DNA-directed RNA polymerase subunit RPC12/RpoP
MASALGIVTCPDCGRVVAVKGRHSTILRPPAAGWRELAQ